MNKDREIAEAATPGPWYREGKTFVWSQHDERLICSIAPSSRNGSNEDFIAHFNPEKIGRMLDEIDRLKAVETDARDALERSLAAVCMWAYKGHAIWCTHDTDGCMCGHDQAVEIVDGEGMPV